MFINSAACLLRHWQNLMSLVKHWLYWYRQAFLTFMPIGTVLLKDWLVSIFWTDFGNEFQSSSWYVAQCLDNLPPYYSLFVYMLSNLVYSLEGHFSQTGIELGLSNSILLSIHVRSSEMPFISEMLKYSLFPWYFTCFLS